MTASTTALSYTTAMLVSIEYAGVAPSSQTFKTWTELPYSIRVQGSMVSFVLVAERRINTLSSCTLPTAVELTPDALAFATQPRASFIQPPNVRYLPHVDTPTTPIKACTASTTAQL